MISLCYVLGDDIGQDSTIGLGVAVYVTVVTSSIVTNITAIKVRRPKWNPDSYKRCGNHQYVATMIRSLPYLRCEAAQLKI